MGRLIPAGTGLKKYRGYEIEVEEPEVEESRVMTEEGLLVGDGVAG